MVTSKKSKLVEGQVTGAQQAAVLVGKDELGLRSNYEGFTPIPDGMVDTFKKFVGFDSEVKVDGTWTKLSPDEVMVVIDHRDSGVVGILWFEYEGEYKDHTLASGKRIQYREKHFIGFKVTGQGDSGVDEARAELSEVQAGLELQAMRMFGGFARFASDVNEESDGSEEEEDESDMMRRLMEEQG